MTRAVRFLPIPTGTVRALQAGAPDAHGAPPERGVSDGSAPCRHCLRDTPEGAPLLTLAHRPFPAPQPYAETGPIFLCADECEAWAGEGLPPMLDSPAYMIRGYDRRDRIVYGTGGVVAREALEASAAEILAREEVAYAHVRSAANGCFQCRVERA